MIVVNVLACACKIHHVTNGELTIGRVNTARGVVLECGADGSCFFHSYIASAKRTGHPALMLAVSSRERASRSL